MWILLEYAANPEHARLASFSAAHIDCLFFLANQPGDEGTIILDWHFGHRRQRGQA